MKYRLIQFLKIVIPLIIGFGLICWIYRDMQWSVVSNILQTDVSYSWFVAVIVFSFFGHFFRALRWQMLLNTIKPNIPFIKIINAVFINYGVNLLLPRMGEVSRCATMSKSESLSFPTLFGTLVGERFIDVITVGLLTIAAVFIQYDYFARNIDDFTHQVDDIVGMFFSFQFYLALLLLAFSLFFIFRYLRNSRFGKKAIHLINNFWQGVLSLTRIKNLWLFVIYSICLWGCYLLQLYLCFFAFDFTSHLTLSSSIVMFAMGSLAYALPVQGAIGPWHFAIIMTMMFYGIDKESAGVFALIAHAIPNLVIVVCAIYASIWFSWKRKSNHSVELLTD